MACTPSTGIEYIILEAIAVKGSRMQVQNLCWVLLKVPPAGLAGLKALQKNKNAAGAAQLCNQESLEAQRTKSI